MYSRSLIQIRPNITRLTLVAICRAKCCSEETNCLDFHPQCDYTNVPTVVLTPLEYAACGLTEEAAASAFGEGGLEVRSGTGMPSCRQDDHHGGYG